METFPAEFDRDGLVEQRHEVVDFGKFDSRLTEPGLQVLLGTLLSVVTRAVVAWIFPARDSRNTMAKSPSAFSTHSAVMGFIEHLAVSKDVAKETVAHFDPLADDFRCSHQQVQRKRRIRF